jgi:hypothetical protein
MDANTRNAVNAPRMLTIRETARLGILPESALRAGVKQGWVPGIYSGVKFFVNVDRLIEYLNGNKNAP